MKKVVFLSDTHLTGRDDDVKKNVINFFQIILEGRSSWPIKSANLDNIDGIVILGDFFDFWFSRGERIYPGFVPIVEALDKLREKGIEIFFCEGNHDFFLEDYFKTRLGIKVYKEWAVIDMDGLRALVSHGDTVDRTDLGYSALRFFLRSHVAFKIQKTLPLAFLWKMAMFCSKLSNTSSNKGHLLDVMYKFSLEKFKEGYDVVILGHCHCPVLRELEQSGGKKVFATLGGWESEGSYLLYNNGRFSLEKFGGGK